MNPTKVKAWMTGPQGGRYYVTATGQKKYGKEAIEAARSEGATPSKDPLARVQAAKRHGVSIEVRLPEEVKHSVSVTLNSLVSKYPELAGLRITEGAPKGTLAIAARGRILIDPEVWRNPEKMAEHARAWEGLMVDASPAGKVTHEAGHVLDRFVSERIGIDKYTEIVQKHFPDVWTDRPINASPSLFGQENSSEFMAETFAASQFNKHARGNTPDADRWLSSSKSMWNELLETARGK